MANEARFEIFPERKKLMEVVDDTPGARVAERPKTGQYMFRFVYANGEVGPTSQQRYGSRTDANRGIHDFMSAINRDHPHPPIIDVED